MSAVPNINPFDANWRIVQDCKDKRATARALSREATQRRIRSHGSKSYDDLDEHTPNPRQHLSLVASSLRLPVFAAPDVVLEPVSLVPDDLVDDDVRADEAPVENDQHVFFDGGIALELIGEDVPEEFAHGLPPGFRIDFEGANDANATNSRTHVHGFERRTLQRAVAQIEPDLDDPEYIYSHCEPLYLPLG
jgi:hypothetical protein